jgi:hypothetical protein
MLIALQVDFVELILIDEVDGDGFEVVIGCPVCLPAWREE